MKDKERYLITVDWCNNGKRGVFCNKQGTGLLKKTKHTQDEMTDLLGVFSIILNPKSEPFTEKQLQKKRKWIPLAEYKHQYGIAIEV